jgi:hypothetical protein
MVSEGIILPLPKSLSPPAYSPDESAIDQFFTEIEVLVRKTGDSQEKPWDERRGLGH